MAGRLGHRQGAAREDRAHAAGVLGRQLGRPRGRPGAAARLHGTRGRGREDGHDRLLRHPRPGLRLVLRRRRRRVRVRPLGRPGRPGHPGPPDPHPRARRPRPARRLRRPGRPHRLPQVRRPVPDAGRCARLHRRRALGLAVRLRGGAPPAARRLRARGRLRAQHVELPHDRGVDGVRPGDLAADRRPDVRHRHVPQRQRLQRRVVQPARPRAGRPPDHEHRRRRPRRAAVGQAARRVRRHVQRRPGRRPVVAGDGPGARPQRAVVS